MVRDESKTIGRRHEEQYADSYSPHDLRLSRVDKTDVIENLLMPKDVVTNLAAQAGSNILLARFEHGVYYQYLPAIYLSHPGSKLLMVAVEAVGLRCLSLARNEGGLMLKARENHALALQSANQHISNLTYRATPYDIVTSILLLALFAVMSSDSSTARDVWTKHVDGAFAIFVAWERQQSSIMISAQSTQNLLGHVINCVQLSCLQRRERLPTEIEVVYQHLPQHNMQVRLHNIVNGLADPHFKLSRHSQTIFPRLQQLYDLDADVSSTLKFLQMSQPFEIISASGSRSGEPVCHAYFSHRSAQVWNFVRVLRLLLNEELVLLLSSTTEQKYCPDEPGWYLALSGRTEMSMAGLFHDFCTCL